MKQLLLVMRHTFLTRVKSFGYWALVLGPIIIIGLFIGGTWAADKFSGNSVPRVSIVSNIKMYKAIETSQHNDMKFTYSKDIKQAKNELTKKKIDAYIISDAKGYSVVNRKDGDTVPKNKLESLISNYQIIENAHHIGISEINLEKVLSSPTFSYKTVGIKDEKSTLANSVISGILSIIVFVFLTSYVGIIANEIANEKSSRIMEILLATSSPNIQFFGKLLGVSLLAFTHALLYVSLGLIASLFKLNIKIFDINLLKLSNINIYFVIESVLVVLVGIMIYMTLTAIVAAMINDMSQVQQAVAPISYISFIGYILAFMVNSYPDGTLMKVLSYTPLISQSLMPARMSIGYANYMNGFVALIIELFALIILSILGSKIYKQNVLSYGESHILKGTIINVKKLFQKNE